MMDADARGVSDSDESSSLVRIGASRSQFGCCGKEGQIGVWKWDGAWRPLGAFRYFQGRRGLFKGVFLGARKYTIRARGAEVWLRGPHWKSYVSFERKWRSTTLRWIWRGEECMLGNRAQLGAHSRLELRIGDREYAVNAHSPASINYGGPLTDPVFTYPPVPGELGAFIEPRLEKRDRVHFSHILLLSLMVRSYQRSVQ